MRVLHTIDVFHLGGIAELIMRLAKNSRHRHDVKCWRGTSSAEADLIGMKTWEGEVTEPYDVIVAHTVGGWDDSNTLRWAKGLGMRTIELMHSVHDSPTNPELVDMFVGVSKLAVEANPQMPRRKHIYSYVDVENFRPKEHGPYIGKLCRLVSEKRPMEFVEIARRLPQEQFLLAGDGPLMPAIRERKPDNLTLLGMVRDLPDFYTKLKLFVHPTQDECCCYSVAYAQVAGLPVICQDIPALRETTGGHAIFRTDIKDFSYAVHQATSVISVLDRMAEEGRQWAHETFNSIEQWDQLIEEV